MSLNIGIIGAGDIAAHHIRAFGALDAQIVMLAGRSEGRVKALAENIGCEWTLDYEKLLARDEIQMVVIGAPNGYHFEMGMAAIEAGKAILCEKTMTTSIPDSQALAQKVAETGTFFHVAYMKRYHPVMARFREWLPQIGQALSGLVRCYQPMPERMWASSSWAFSKQGGGGGPLVHAGSHTLDLLHWVLGDVAALSAAVTKHPQAEVDRTTSGILEMANACTLALEVGWMDHPNWGVNHDGWDEVIQIRGTEGILTLQATFWDRPDLIPSVSLHKNGLTQTFTAGPMNYFAAQAEDVLRRFQNGEEAFITAQDGLWVDRVIHSLYAASEQKTRLSLS